MEKKTYKKIALAYSGGLDTSIIIPWLKENYGGAEIIGVSVDVGQKEDWDAVKKKGEASGASKLFIVDAKEEFAQNYLFPMLRAGALYEGKYLLGTAIARPVTAMYQVKYALQEGCDAVAHGCTGKGNDQVRFEMTYKALAPHLGIIAPWREWDITSREQAIDYAQARKIPLGNITKQNIYSRDWNVWHMSHEGAELEDPMQRPLETKKNLANTYARLVYTGKWFTAFRVNLDAFFESSSRYLTGTVKVVLYKGNVLISGRTSPYSLYSEDLASFGKSTYDHHDATGFLRLYSLATGVQASVQKDWNKA